MTAVAIYDHAPAAKELFVERLVRGWTPTASDLRAGDRVVGLGECAVTTSGPGSRSKAGG